MWRYNYLHMSELYHHGIKGQKWGVRRYQNPDGTLTKAGKERYNSKDGIDPVTATYTAIAVAPLVAKAVISLSNQIDAYKHREFKTLLQYGKKTADTLLEPEKAGIKRLSTPESLNNALKNTNPLKGKPEAENNCVLSSIAGEMRRRGFDVIAKPSNGEIPQERMWECFKNVDVKYASGKRFGKSPSEAAKMLKELYGEDARGFCSVTWKNSEIGHCFSFQIEKGQVTFVDYQQGIKGADVEKYWKHISPIGLMRIGRLDNTEVNWSGVVKAVNNGNENIGKDDINVQE